MKRIVIISVLICLLRGVSAYSAIVGGNLLNELAQKISCSQWHLAQYPVPEPPPPYCPDCREEPEPRERPQVRPQPSSAEIARSDSAAINDRGASFYKSGNYSAALDSFLSALKRDPSNTVARSNFYGTSAVLSQQRRNFEEALKNAQQATAAPEQDTQGSRQTSGKHQERTLANIDQSISAIDEREKHYVATLNLLREQFQRDVGAFNEWAGEAQRGMDKAVELRNEITFNVIGKALLEQGGGGSREAHRQPT